MTKRLSLALIAVLLCTIAIALASEPTVPMALLLTEQPLSSEDVFTLRNYQNGDRATKKTCTTPGGIEVSAEVVPEMQGTLAMILTAARGDKVQRTVLSQVRTFSRYTHACDTALERFYVGDPSSGTVYAIAADAFLDGGLNRARLWKKNLPSFTPAAFGPDAPPLFEQGAISGLTALAAKQGHLMIEWITHGENRGYYHLVVDANGEPVSMIGPSTMMLRTNHPGERWQLFYDDNVPLDPINYRVTRLYEAAVGPAAADDPSNILNVLAELATAVPSEEKGPLAKLDTISPVAHMVALLTPSRTAERVVPEFCGQTPPERARVWLGTDYDGGIAGFARSMLIAWSAELSSQGYGGDSIESWFEAEVAPNPPMSEVIASWDGSDASFAAYQQALLEQAGSVLHETIRKFSSPPPGRESGSVILDEAPAKEPPESPDPAIKADKKTPEGSARN